MPETRHSFSNEIVPSSLTSLDETKQDYFRSLKDRPDLVLRKSKRPVYATRYDNELHKTVPVYDEKKKIVLDKQLLQRHIDQKQIFTELSDHFGIAVARHDYVITEDDQNQLPQLYTVTEKIEGQDVNALTQQKISKEILQQIDQFCAKFFKYLIDKSYASGKVFMDFKPSNITYGKATNDAAPKLYITDLDPNFIAFSGDKHEDLEAIRIALHRTVDTIKAIEDNTNSKLAQSRIYASHLYHLSQESFKSYQAVTKDEIGKKSDMQNTLSYYGQWISA